MKIFFSSPIRIKKNLKAKGVNFKKMGLAKELFQDLNLNLYSPLISHTIMYYIKLRYVTLFLTQLIIEQNSELVT